MKNVEVAISILGHLVEHLLVSSTLRPLGSKACLGQSSCQPCFIGPEWLWMFAVRIVALNLSEDSVSRDHVLATHSCDRVTAHGSFKG